MTVRLLNCAFCPHPEHAPYHCTQCECRASSTPVKDLLPPRRKPLYNSLRHWARPDSPRTVEELTRDCYAAHDRIKTLIGENDRLRAACLALDRRQRFLLKVFIVLQTLTWSVLGGAIKYLLPFAIHGMAK